VAEKISFCKLNVSIHCPKKILGFVFIDFLTNPNSTLVKTFMTSVQETFCSMVEKRSTEFRRNFLVEFFLTHVFEP